jgi:hypothetical protein
MFFSILLAGIIIGIAIGGIGTIAYLWKVIGRK